MQSTTYISSLLAEAIRSATSDVLAQAKELEKTKTEWADVQDKIKRTVANVPSIVKLNVGGAIFETSKDTLLRVEGSYFHVLLGSGHWKPQESTNAYFLDMDPTLFRRVLMYLRTGTMMPMKELTKIERDELMAMIEYLKVCPWGVGTQLIRWNRYKKSSVVTLSNDLRTLTMELGQSESGGAIATEALKGTFRLRVDVAAGDFFVGVCPMAGFNRYCIDVTAEHSYRYRGNGKVYERKWKTQTRARIQAGDVVTIQRGASNVTFTLNDGAPVQVALKDPDEELFPVVFMKSPVKVTTV